MSRCFLARATLLSPRLIHKDGHKCPYVALKSCTFSATFVQIIGKKQLNNLLLDLCKYWKSETSVRITEILIVTQTKASTEDYNNQSICPKKQSHFFRIPFFPVRKQMAKKVLICILPRFIYRQNTFFFDTNDDFSSVFVTVEIFVFFELFKNQTES